MYKIYLTVHTEINKSKGDAKMLFTTRQYNNLEYKYEKQLDNVDHLVLNTITEKKNIQISMRDLYEILKVCHDYRVID